MNTFNKLSNRIEGLGKLKNSQKRLFDIFFSLLGILITFWIIVLAWIAASIETSSNGFFFQTRVGRYGKFFKVIKIKTMHPINLLDTTVTREGDPRITKLGKFFRSTKIDELPQLWNILLGEMSFVGPRPDVPGFADKLEGLDKKILSVRPGITGPATIKYRNEMKILEKQRDFEFYNKNIIWPDKVRINIDYINNWSLMGDIKYILKTLLITKK